MRKYLKAFTLIELLVVMAILATLLTITLPRYYKSVDRSKEQVLLTNLITIRESIDKYYTDKGHYPSSLEALVSAGYIKGLPYDPITESEQTWILIKSTDVKESGVIDIKSGSEGFASNNSKFNEW